MKLVPVKRWRSPAYPTRDILNRHPELLYLVPQRWRRNRLALAALSGVLSLSLANQGCRAGPRAGPVFIHGEGRGALGCVVVNPPVFLTEDDARQVVQDEAKQAGLDFGTAGYVLRDAPIPVTKRHLISLPFGLISVRTGDLVLDGFDRKSNAGYTFVSEADFEAWKDKGVALGELTTVSSMNILEAAQVLEAGLARRRSAPWLGVFYDPMARMRLDSATIRTGDTRKAHQAAHQLGEQELRKQVRDFIRWLKAQGVV